MLTGNLPSRPSGRTGPSRTQLMVRAIAGEGAQVQNHMHFSMLKLALRWLTVSNSNINAGDGHLLCIIDIVEMSSGCNKKREASANVIYFEIWHRICSVDGVQCRKTQ
jgi:hypothetical protein